MLDDHAHADKQAHRQRTVQHPGPVFIAHCAEKKEEQHQIEPRPHTAHSLEVAEEAVHSRRGEESRKRRGDEESSKRQENRFAAEIKSPSAETQRQDQYRSAYLDQPAEIQVARNYVREKESV